MLIGLFQQCDNASEELTGTACSGPLFFGPKLTGSASRRSSPALPVSGTMESSDAAG
jgi:hypothetical protein